MDTDDLLALLHDSTRKEFESSFATLKAAKAIDIDALDACVRFLSTLDSYGITSPREELGDFVLRHIVDESSSDWLYRITEACLRNASDERLSSKIYQELRSFDHDLSPESVATGKAYLAFLKCSFWLPKGYHRMVNSDSLGLISRFISIDELEDTAHNTLSAFFSLLRTDKELLLSSSLINQSFWLQINALDIKCFTLRSSKIFRTWFQWISQAASDGLMFECVHDEQYWKRIRLGLVNGHADQRKYCLGILRQSFLVTEGRIETSSIRYGANQSDREKYDLYTTLYETIVLHRYTGQVEDCLPSLTGLLGSTKGTASKITPAMATTLLTAALDPLIQESIRKMIGRWYMDFVIEVSYYYPKPHPATWERIAAQRYHLRAHRSRGWSCI
jgi:tRNA guanosine-2'-O-methyltransferase